MARRKVVPLRRRIFLVNEFNQEWVADHTGTSLIDVQSCYQEAQKNGTVCWIEETSNV